jgi:ABC-type glycerol-3-phosphate transport system substrate-binding protein
MKKSFLCFLIVSALFLTTACGNKSDNDEKEDSKSKTETLTCTSSETDEDGLKTEDTAVIKVVL